MIDRLKQLFSVNETDLTPEHSVQLACAALMIEVMVIDRQIAVSEKKQVVNNIHHRFQVSTEEAENLFNLAQKEVTDATSLYQFTKTVNLEFTNQQKFELIKALWQVAYADDELDKHEEALIRRIAELLHFPHSQFIRAKKMARL